LEDKYEKRERKKRENQRKGRKRTGIGKYKVIINQNAKCKRREIKGRRVRGNMYFCIAVWG
jgi:hypothetical protein